MKVVAKAQHMRVTSLMDDPMHEVLLQDMSLVRPSSLSVT